jgi:hypothetical protein
MIHLVKTIIPFNLNTSHLNNELTRHYSFDQLYNKFYKIKKNNDKKLKKKKKKKAVKSQQYISDNLCYRNAI